MKVLYVLSLDDNFGAPRALMEMIQTLKKQYNITPVVLTPLKNKINDECDKLNIENYHILYGTSMYRKGDKLLNVLRYLLYKYGNIVSLRLIKNKINFDEIDFIHSNNSVIDFGYRLSKKYNKKHFWHLREFSDLDFNYYPFEKKYYSKMNDSINIGISQTIIDAWKKKGLRNINLVYDGLDFSSIKTKKKYININNRKISNTYRPSFELRPYDNDGKIKPHYLPRNCCTYQNGRPYACSSEGTPLKTGWFVNQKGDKLQLHACPVCGTVYISERFYSNYKDVFKHIGQ